MRARTPAKSLPAREPAPPREAARPRMAAPPGGTSGRLRVAAVVRGSPARPAGSAVPHRARAAPSPPVIPSTSPPAAPPCTASPSTPQARMTGSRHHRRRAHRPLGRPDPRRGRRLRALVRAEAAACALKHAVMAELIRRRPSTQAEFEHNVPYEADGRTCLCNGGPKCRHEHRLKQHPGWNVEQITPGTFCWTAPSGRQYTTEPTRYPILSRVPWGRPFRWISSRTRPERANGHDRGRSTPRYRGASPAVRGRRRAPPPGHGVRRGSDDRTATGRSDAAGWGSAG